MKKGVRPDKMRRARRWLAWMCAGMMLLWAFVWGCGAPEFAGVSPNPGAIHYPVSLAVHPSGKFLYVANSNFDLAYTGGTMNVFQTEELDRDKIPGQRRIFVNGIEQKLKSLQILEKATVEMGSFAGDMILNQRGDRLYIAMRQDKRLGSQKDCNQDSDCAETEECLRSRCSFRQNQELAAIQIIKVNASQTPEKHFSCDQKKIPENYTGGVGDEAKFEKTPALRCSDSSKLFFDNNPFPFNLALSYACVPKRKCQQDSDCACGEDARKQGLCQVDQRCDVGRCVTGCTKDGDCLQGEACQLGRCRTKAPTGKSCSTDTTCGEGLRCDNGKCATGCRVDRQCKNGERCASGRCVTPLATSTKSCDSNTGCAAWETCQERRLVASHLQSGGFSDITLTNAQSGIAQKPSDFKRIAQQLSVLPTALTGLAMLPSGTPVGGGGELFLSSRINNNVFVIPPAFDPNKVSDVRQFPFAHLDNRRPTDFDLRSVTLGYDKKNNWVRLYVSSRRPAAILVYDVSRDLAGRIVLSQVAIVPVGLDPASSVYRARPKGEADLLYVVCSRDERIDVIDTQSLQVVHQIPVGQQPYFMTIYEPKSASDVQRRRAYVANFLDTSISIIDLDTHRVVGLVTGIDTTPKVN